MSDTFKIENVEYFSQRDNVYVPSSSCFPTSLAMCMNYCLQLIGKTKIDVGCDAQMQLEDYLDYMLDDDKTKKWMTENTSRLGNWIWNYNRRVLYDVEAYTFNRLMLPLGFKATFYSNLNYIDLCNKLEETKIPAVIGGNFSEISNVKGHMNCLIGFNKLGLEEFIVHDPYGNALTKYQVGNGKDIRYPKKFFTKGTDLKIYAVVIERV